MQVDKSACFVCTCTNYLVWKPSYNGAIVKQGIKFSGSAVMQLQRGTGSHIQWTSWCVTTKGNQIQWTSWCVTTKGNRESNPMDQLVHNYKGEEGVKSNRSAGA